MWRFSKGAVLLVCWVRTSSGCSAQALFPAGKSLSVGAERGLTPFSGWSLFPGWIFPLSRATFTLICWKLSYSSFGLLGICVLPPKRTVILAKKKKKRWKLFICRASWPSPTFKLQNCYLEGKGNPESQVRMQIAFMCSKTWGNDLQRELGAESRKSGCWMEICTEIGKGGAGAPVPLWSSEGTCGH